MQRTVRVALVALITLGFLGSASAQTSDFGKLWVDSNVKHVRVEIDGRVYDEVEYARGGKRAVIDDLVFSKLPLKITLIPRQDGYKPVTIEVKRSDFKKRREGRMYVWIAKAKVKFVKAKKSKKKPAKKPKKKPAKKPAKPADDDL